MEILTGLREKIYLGWFNFTVLPGPLNPQHEGQWEDRRMASGLMVRRAAYPYSGACVSPGKLSWVLTWVTPQDETAGASSTDLENLLRLQARAAYDSMDFCLWAPDCEAFWIATGETAAGTLPRRAALSVIDAGYWPATAATRFATKSYEGGSAGNITLGAVDSTRYRQAWSGGTANALNEIIYVPCYRVWAEFHRTFGPVQAETWTVTLREV